MRPPSLLSSSSWRQAAGSRPAGRALQASRSLNSSSSSKVVVRSNHERAVTPPTPTTPRAPAAASAAALAASTSALVALALLSPCAPAAIAAGAELSPPPAATATTNNNTFIADGARMLSPQDETAIAARLERLAQETGWKLRVVTVDGLSARGGREAARAALSLPAYASSLPSFDRRTVLLQADPSAPALLSIPYVGDDALRLLGRPFFTELESRFGNQFYTRENGSPKALRDAVGALELCLARDPPCRVVPGLPEEQLQACLTFAVAGGIIAGGASKIKGGSGPLQWVLLFAPLWFSLVASFGVGPVVSRLAEGEREAPVAMVLGAFAASALLPWAPEVLGTRKAFNGGGGGEDGV